MLIGRHERDVLLLLSARCLRTFSYGGIAVVLYMFLLNEFSPLRVAHLLTSVMIGDFIMSLVISVYADSFLGRRNALKIGATAKLIAGLSFVCFPSNYTMLLIGATIGVVTPTGGEIGPFLNVEQAALADISKLQCRTDSAPAAPGDKQKEDESSELHVLSFVIAWYQVLGGLSAALGALLTGVVVQSVEEYLHGRNAALGDLRAPTVNIGNYNRSSNISSSDFPWQKRNPVVATMLALNETLGSEGGVGDLSTVVPDLNQRHAYMVIFGVYTLIAGLLLIIYSQLSDKVEAEPYRADEMVSSDSTPSAPVAHIQTDAINDRNIKGIPLVSDFLHDYIGLRTVEKHRDILWMAVLFSIDAFAGALIVQSYIALWLSQRWGISESQIGVTLMVINAIGGLSGFVASWLVRRIGAIRTMVFTHLPSNFLTFLIPLMPSSVSAQAMLFARYSISQMDVPARQAYVVTIVPSSERSAANGIVNSARTIGVAIAPWFLQWFLKSTSAMAVPFYVAACIKIGYDITLYLSFEDKTTTLGEAAEAAERVPLAEATSLEVTYGTAMPRTSVQVKSQ